MDRDRVEPTIYAAVLSALERRVTLALLGTELTEDAMTGAGRGGFTHLRSLRGFLADLIERDDRSLLSGGASWRGTARGRSRRRGVVAARDVGRRP